MPTPRITGGMRVLIRTKPIKDSEWIELIEARREHIKPYLDKFSLFKLGDVQHIRHGLAQGDFPLDYDNPEVIGNSKFDLNTQGIFACQSWEARVLFFESEPDSFGVCQIWGLTRSGCWVLATARTIVEPRSTPYNGYEKVVSVEIVETDIATIIKKTKETPVKIWKTLSEAIKSFAENRKYLYERALHLANEIEAEDELLWAVLRRTTP